MKFTKLLNEQLPTAAKHWRALSWLLVIVLAFVAGTYLTRIPAVGQQLRLATTHQPERLTELYFNNPNNLPATVSGGKSVTVSFRVHNLEYQDTTYHARISLVTDGKVQVIATKTFMLPQDGAVDLPITYTPQGIGHNYQLIIDLPQQHESIYFRSHS